ncbi:MAG: hypothetical protein OER88_10525 [Planctomycetota bacterium]|nr:hypothetical protein [Planctomycetota bacterium]
MRTPLIVLVAAASFAFAQGRGPRGPGLVKPMQGQRVAWFGTLTAGLAEAKRTQRPIVLISAAPHCHNVPGVW